MLIFCLIFTYALCHFIFLDYNLIGALLAGVLLAGSIEILVLEIVDLKRGEAYTLQRRFKFEKSTNGYLGEITTLMLKKSRIRIIGLLSEVFLFLIATFSLVYNILPLEFAVTLSNFVVLVFLLRNSARGYMEMIFKNANSSERQKQRIKLVLILLILFPYVIGSIFGLQYAEYLLIAFFDLILVLSIPFLLHEINHFAKFNLWVAQKMTSQN